MMKYKIILWGLGAIYNKHINLLKYMEAANVVEVVALTAQSIPAIRYLDCYPVITKDKLCSLEYDFIIVMNDKYFQEIVDEVVECGVLRKQILSYKILEIPNINFEEYIKLKQSDISIVSNNCWGGIIYQTLGMECLSPFKNLFLTDYDYIKLLANLKEYLFKEIGFSKWEIDIHSKERYPVLLLGDIEIHCNHDTDAGNAIKKWKQRLIKFNYNNIFVEMYTENLEIAEKFILLEEHKKKVCFVPTLMKEKYFKEIEEVWALEMFPGQTEFWQTVNSNAGNGRSIAYNPIDLLNLKQLYRYQR